MAKIQVNNMTMHYLEKGEGPPVILVHGLTASLAFWYATKVFPELSNDFRTVAYDLRGHGYTETTPSGYTSNSLATDLRDLMDTIGIDRARIIGHSYGGSVALHFGLLFPERTDGIVLCDTGFASLRHLRKIDNWPGWKIWQEELPDFGITPDWFAQADNQGIEAVLERSVNVPVQFGLRRGTSRNTPRFRKLLKETSVGTDFRDPAGLSEESLPKITPPVLCVYGDISPFRNVAAYLCQAMPNCASVILPDQGHFFLFEAADAFLEQVRPFLRDPAQYVREQKELCAAQNKDGKAE